MNSSVQEKLQKMKESKLIDDFKSRLTAFECFAVVQANDLPSSLDPALATAYKTDTPRHDQIACTASRASKFAWIERMFAESGIKPARFYLSTQFRFFPWLDCNVIGEDWIQNLNDTRDLNFSVISHDKTKFLSISNEEHSIDAYWRTLS